LEDKRQYAINQKYYLTHTLNAIMKKIIPALVALLSCLYAGAQTGPLLSSGHFLLRGKVKNPSREFLEVGVSGFMGDLSESILIPPNGIFSKSIPVTHAADFYCMFDKLAVLLFALPGDTIDLSWDDREAATTLKVMASKPDRQQELNLRLELYRDFMTGFRDLNIQVRSKEVPDSVKFDLVKKHFANQIQIAQRYPLTSNSRKIYGDIYYQHINLLDVNDELLYDYKLSFKDVLGLRVADSLGVSDLYFETLEEPLFYQSKEYRDYIFDLVRFKVFDADEELAKQRTSNFTMNDCIAGAAILNSLPTIKDWYLARAILFGFAHYGFEVAEEAYRKYHTDIGPGYFRDTLEHFYKAIQRLKPGAPAPAFTLKDPDGKKVSLSDFKNKIVYIDFWGFTCGPCIYEIKNHAEKLYAKYKDKDVVFLNICVDAKQKEFKEKLKKLPFEGVHLLAEGFTNHPVCSDYNVNSVPRYIIIDKQGRIVNSTAGRPGELLNQPDNEIDKLLKP
jgi:thiol-disulfide isomerase/thioredoxin